MCRSTSLKKYYIYTTPYLRALECRNCYCFVYEKKTGKYFYRNEPFKNLKIRDYEVKSVGIQWIDVLSYLLIFASPYLLFMLINAVIVAFNNISIDCILLSALFLLCNIFLHELSHYVALKIYGENCSLPKIKLENGILKVYTDTSASYLLPPYKRIVVYYAGLLTNIYFCYVLVFVVGISANMTIFTLLLVLINMVPSSVFTNDIMQIIKLCQEINKRYKS